MESAPFFADIANGPSGGCAYWVRTRDGIRIRLGLWPAGNAKAQAGSVLLYPGRTEYIEKYGPVARDLAAAGYVTLAIDWRGQGLSGRTCQNVLVGHVRNFNEYRLDVAAMYEAAEALDLPRPYYLLAHSMGGTIALRALHEGLPVKAVTFSAPMWGIVMSPQLRLFAWGSSWLSHHLTAGCTLAPGTGLETAVLASPFEDNDLTTDPEMYAFMQAQARARPELTLGGPSLSWLYSALCETRDLMRLKPPEIPAFTGLGSHERIIETRPVQAHMARWGAAGRLEIIAGAEHELLMEAPDKRARFTFEILKTFARTIA